MNARYICRSVAQHVTLQTSVHSLNTGLCVLSMKRTNEINKQVNKKNHVD